MCRYFGGVETITVPGFTYEVQDYYLDDVLTMVGNPHSKRNDGASKAPATTQKAVRATIFYTLLVSLSFICVLMRIASSELSPA